mmetsp:Transcript_45664/g.90647  ORF Transcript_45664/g.90647 Transcript_45664/m.90647 type:complete len:234 (+) Transcript_45664:1620-2321(+)
MHATRPKGSSAELQTRAKPILIWQSSRPTKRHVPAWPPVLLPALAGTVHQPRFVRVTPSQAYRPPACRARVRPGQCFGRRLPPACRAKVTPKQGPERHPRRAALNQPSWQPIDCAQCTAGTALLPSPALPGDNAQIFSSRGRQQQASRSAAMRRKSAVQQLGPEHGHMLPLPMQLLGEQFCVQEALKLWSKLQRPLGPKTVLLQSSATSEGAPPKQQQLLVKPKHLLPPLLHC